MPTNCIQWCKFNNIIAVFYSLLRAFNAHLVGGWFTRFYYPQFFSRLRSRVRNSNYVYSNFSHNCIRARGIFRLAIIIDWTINLPNLTHFFMNYNYIICFIVFEITQFFSNQHFLLIFPLQMRRRSRMKALKLLQLFIQGMISVWIFAVAAGITNNLILCEEEWNEWES